MAAIGTVYLVGAGPGDPGLLTLRAVECLQSADLVLYDGLVNPRILQHTQAETERTCRAETIDGRRLDQEEINRHLIEAARSGLTVVRLKGGDPFIFGRGSEEAAALRQAGIPFEVVPGITSATAAGAYAGFSLTHRACASAVALVTGHEDPGKPESLLDYAALAAFPGTLVFYMGLHRLRSIVAALIAHGMSASTPAAVVCRATTPGQRTVVSELESLPAAVEQARLKPPSLIIVGPCVLQREQIQWYEHKPLFGQRIVITRPEPQMAETADAVVRLGGEPLELPLIELRPLKDFDEVDATIRALSEIDWLVFTSQNGATIFLDRLLSLGLDLRALGGTRLAAIGPATAEALGRYHLVADVVPDEYRAEALADALEPLVKGQRVVWIRASRGRDVLPTRLQAAGADYAECVVYQHVDVSQLDELVKSRIVDGEVDWIALSSPAIARSLATQLDDSMRQRLGAPTRIAAISPVTEQAAREAGLPVHVVAQDYTWPGLLAAIGESPAAPTAS